MNMNFKFLLIGTSLSLIPNLTYAQCAVTDCQQLGYTSLEKCDNSLKCPFGEYWACPKVEEKAVLGECTGYAKNCKIADILNSDGTCTTDKVSGKTPIGVVVYIGGDGCGQAVALKDFRSAIWSTENVDIPDLPNYMSVWAVEKDFDSCGNTQKIIKQGNANKYPAAWVAVNYAPSSAPATKGKWCFPAAGVGNSMMVNIDKINSSLFKAGSQSLPGSPSNTGFYASSSEYNNIGAWLFCTGCGGGGTNINGLSKYQGGIVLPVLEF